MGEKINFGNISIDNITLERFLQKTTTEKMLVVTPNVDHLMKLKKDPDFLKIYRVADYVLCDSKIIQFGSKLLGTPVQEKISGSDLFPAFCQYHRDNQNIKIFILGGMDGVAQQAQTNINQKIGREIVVSALSPSFGFGQNKAECLEIVEKINASGANVLAIGVGSPKQEKWILQYRFLLPKVHIYFPIGATIDFEAGKTSRSPRWMSNAGLEWLYRLLLEPRRLWKRYLVDDFPFLFDLLKYRLGLYYDDRFLCLQSLPLGLMLHEAGLLSAEDLNSVVELQKKANYQKRIGEIIVDNGLLESETIDFFAEDLPRLIKERKILTLEEYLQQAHLVSPSQQTIDWFEQLIDLCLTVKS